MLTPYKTPTRKNYRYVRVPLCVCMYVCVCVCGITIWYFIVCYHSLYSPKHKHITHTRTYTDAQVQEKQHKHKRVELNNRKETLKSELSQKSLLYEDEIRSLKEIERYVCVHLVYFYSSYCFVYILLLVRLLCLLLFLHGYDWLIYYCCFVIVVVIYMLNGTILLLY